MSSQFWPSIYTSITIFTIITLLIEETSFVQYMSAGKKKSPSLIFLQKKKSALTKNICSGPIKKRWYISVFLRNNHIVFLIFQEKLGENKRLLKNPFPEAKATLNFRCLWMSWLSLFCPPQAPPWQLWVADSLLGRQELAWVCSVCSLCSEAALSCHSWMIRVIQI